MLFDNWFSEYFKTNEGSYADPLIAKSALFDEDVEISQDIQGDDL